MLQKTECDNVTNVLPSTITILFNKRFQIQGTLYLENTLDMPKGLYMAKKTRVYIEWVSV